MIVYLFPPASLMPATSHQFMFAIAYAGFLLITFVYFAWFMILLKQALNKSHWPQRRKDRILYGTLAALIAWMGVIGGLAWLGAFSRFDVNPPRFVVVVIVPLVTVIWISSRETTKHILKWVPPVALLYLQTFRIFVEILLLLLFLENVIPVQMSIEGLNYDILAGFTAPVVAFLYSKRKISPAGVKVWNAVGLMLLINIVAISILSSPVPIRIFMNEPANTIVTMFPFVYLPGMLVPLAYGLHILSWKQMSILQSGRSMHTVAADL
jgi:hypothetical protein